MLEYYVEWEWLESNGIALPGVGNDPLEIWEPDDVVESRVQIDDDMGPGVLRLLDAQHAQASLRWNMNIV